MTEVLDDYFICPISLEIMSDPVIAADGTTYERICIERWLESHDTSPKTNQVLPSKALIPNYSIRNCIHKLKRVILKSLIVWTISLTSTNLIEGSKALR